MEEKGGARIRPHPEVNHARRSPCLLAQTNSCLVETSPQTGDPVISAFSRDAFEVAVGQALEYAGTAGRRREQNGVHGAGLRWHLDRVG